MIFSVLTFNMQNGQPWNESDPDACDIDLDGTVEFLRGQNADVIFLQEVERGYDGGEQIEPPPNYTRLREALKGYDSVFAYPPKNSSELPFGLGLAIFSKSKLRDVARVELPAADVGFDFGGRPRTPSERLLLAASTVIDGRALRLLNTHLQAYFMIGTSSEEHRGQRDRVEEELRAQSGPVLLAGDFNCAPDEQLLGQFAAAGYQPVQTDEVTWRRKPFVLDHIFFNSAMRLEGRQVVRTTASDHHAVRAEFSFAK